MHLQKRRTQKAKSEHQLDKKNFRTFKILHSMKSDVLPCSNMTINYSRRTRIEHIFIPHTYNGKRKYNWEGRKETVERAISDAIVHLEKAYRDPMVQPHKFIIDAIQKVINTLGNQELKIYPFFGQSDGLAKIGEDEISIRTTLVNDTMKDADILREGIGLYRLEKTLIHEAFHIIGGCVEGKSNDSICEECVDKKEAFEKIVSKSSIQEMEADDFAHFIMRC